MVKDDVPLVGRIVDPEGRPVAGATVRVTGIWASQNEDLTPWLDAVGRSYQELRSAAVDDRDTILAIADEMRIAPALSGSEGLVVPGEDAFGPIVADVPLHVLLRSLWSGDVVLASIEPAGAEQHEAAAERWRSLAEDHPGSARLWLDLANRAEHTARSLRREG